MNNDCLAELTGVNKRFGKTVALDGLDLQVRSGELLAVLGPNGAGKTTAISLLLGLERPDAGSARLFGQLPQRVETRRNIGVMMQEVALAQALAGRPYGKLSGGQKRQAQFAMAICGRPRLLFLDEPTVGLDVEARQVMWTRLRQLVSQGASIVLTTHYLEEAEALADRVVVLARGRMIASGTVSEIRANVVRKHISCSTTIGAAQVETWPGVESVTYDQRRLHITASNAQSVVRRLMAADENLDELEVHRAGLAEAFTELTQEKPL